MEWVHDPGTGTVGESLEKGAWDRLGEVLNDLSHKKTEEAEVE